MALKIIAHVFSISIILKLEFYCPINVIEFKLNYFLIIRICACILVTHYYMLSNDIDECEYTILHAVGEEDRSENFFLIGCSSYLPARVPQLRVIFSLRMQFMIMNLVALQLRC